MPETLEKTLEWLRKLEGGLLSAGILLLAGLTAINVVARSLFAVSLASLEEVSQFLMIGITFVGLAYGAGLGRHIRMTAITDQLGAGSKKALMVLSSSVTCALMLLLTWYSVDYIETVATLETVSPALQVPVYLVYCVVPLGLVLTAVEYGLTVVKNLTTEGVWASATHSDDYDDAVQPGI